MSYLPFNSIGDADYRNRQEATARGCVYPVTHWWEYIEVNGVHYLNVEDGSGLTDEEQLKVELELPNLSETNNETM